MYTPSELFDKRHSIIEDEDLLPSGYYALRRGDTAVIDFIRVSRPTKGRFKDSFKVQTQHSDMLRPALEHFQYLARPYNRLRVAVFHSGIEDKLWQVIQERQDCQLLYAREKKRCFSCGKKLTDARSRWYGFGKECEKHLQVIKQLIEDERGTDFEHAPVEIDF